MSAVHAVLLVPEEGDPLGLLAEVPGDEMREDWPRAIPPQAYLCAGRWFPYDPRKRPPYGSLHEYAIVLAWEGEVLWQGCATLQNFVPLRRGGGVTLNVRNLLARGRPYGTNHGWPGTLVLLDADGREVTP